MAMNDENGPEHLGKWEAALRASGLPRITPHGARHSGATNLIAAGVPVSAVQRLLGHADGGFTMKRYVHPGEVELSMAMDALEQLHEGAPIALRKRG